MTEMNKFLSLILTFQLCFVTSTTQAFDELERSTRNGLESLETVINQLEKIDKDQLTNSHKKMKAQALVNKGHLILELLKNNYHLQGAELQELKNLENELYLHIERLELDLPRGKSWWDQISGYLFWGVSAFVLGMALYFIVNYLPGFISDYFSSPDDTHSNEDEENNKEKAPGFATNYDPHHATKIIKDLQHLIEQKKQFTEQYEKQFTKEFNKNVRPSLIPLMKSYWKRALQDHTTILQIKRKFDKEYHAVINKLTKKEKEQLKNSKTQLQSVTALLKKVDKKILTTPVEKTFIKSIFQEYNNNAPYYFEQGQDDSLKGLNKILESIEKFKKNSTIKLSPYIKQLQNLVLINKTLLKFNLSMRTTYENFFQSRDIYSKTSFRQHLNIALEAKLVGEIETLLRKSKPYLLKKDHKKLYQSNKKLKIKFLNQDFFLNNYYSSLRMILEKKINLYLSYQTKTYNFLFFHELETYFLLQTYEFKKNFTKSVFFDQSFQQDTSFIKIDKDLFQFNRSILIPLHHITSYMSENSYISNKKELTYIKKKTQTNPILYFYLWASKEF